MILTKSVLHYRFDPSSDPALSGLSYNDTSFLSCYTNKLPPEYQSNKLLGIALHSDTLFEYRKWCGLLEHLTDTPEKF